MSKELFRQKSLDKLKSPDNLDEYIKRSGLTVSDSIIA